MSGTLEKQLQLEQEMVTGGIDRFRKTRDQAITSGKEAAENWTRICLKWLNEKEIHRRSAVQLVAKRRLHTAT